MTSTALSARVNRPVRQERATVALESLARHPTTHHSLFSCQNITQALRPRAKH
ncbi:hypothetical protein ABG768_009460, partial [Culter alburnus]